MKISVTRPHEHTAAAVRAVEDMQKIANPDIDREFERLLEMAGDYPELHAYAESLEEKIIAIKEEIDA